jgi:hypothetical protein
MTAADAAPVPEPSVTDDVRYVAESITLTGGRTTTSVVAVAFHGPWLVVVGENGSRSVYPSHVVQSVNGLSRSR